MSTRNPFYVDPDITKASTLPSEVYTDPTLLKHQKDTIFTKSWQWLGGPEWKKKQYNLHPVEFIPGFLPEPMVVETSGENIRCFSNVCTHRAKILVEEPAQKNLISCRYHGRCFHLDGSFKSMPEFQQTADFPTEKDNLFEFPVQEWNGFYFHGIKPEKSLKDMLKPISDHLPRFPYQSLRLMPEMSQTYKVEAHWLTYCDNYLEGFHIPFVHPALHQAVRFEDYEVRVFDHSNVQIARCKPGQTAINLLPDDPDFGQEIYAYYWFVYPNLMLNFYHWGISVNWVLPRTNDCTEIRFLTYLRQDISSDAFVKTALDLTEMEDEAVVESVQKGLKSSIYNRGRFSPTREQGVHAFHAWLYHEVFQYL